jgi:hypothetical protein
LYNPSISASGGADAIQDPANKKVFTIVPQGKECIVGVTSNTNGQNLKIDDIKYSVIAPPRPQIQIIVNGKIYDGSTPIPKKSTLTVKIVPDKEFLEKLPADARYEIGTARVLVQRGLGVPKEVTNTNASGKDARTGISVPLGTSLQNDNAGTKIYVVVDKIYRVNFKSQKVEENFIETERMVGAVIQ